MRRTLALLVLASLVLPVPALALRATAHLDALEVLLGERAAALAGATDGPGKKQARTATKALTRIGEDTASASEDLTLLKKIAGRVAKAFGTDTEVMDELTAAADVFEDLVDHEATRLGRLRDDLPEAKLTKKAGKQLAKADKHLARSRAQTKLKKRVKFLDKARRASDRALELLATALGTPEATRLVVSPPSALLTELGASVVLEARVFDQLGRPMDSTVMWGSSDPAIADVDATGFVTAGEVGAAQVTASLGALSATAPIVSARPASGAVPVADDDVVGPIAPVDPDDFGIGAEYTVLLRGTPPTVGDLLFGTGQLPIGGEVVAIEASGPDWLVTLAIVPLDVLFDELEVSGSFPLANEHAVVPERVTELLDAELGDDGTWTFTEREDAAAAAGLARGVQGTVAEQGPFECKSPVPFPLALAAGLSFQLQQNFALDLEYSTLNGLERLVLEGQSRAEASFKPRVTAAISASVECKAELLQLNFPLPGPLAIAFGTQIPVGAGFKISGSVQAAQAGFDAILQATSTSQAGVACTAGNCDTVATTTNTTTGTFAWVLPDPSTQFTVQAAVQGFGYAELCLGNPIWDVLQLCMFEAQAGLEQTLAWSPTLVQFNNPTSASNYKLLLYFMIGAKAELANVAEFFTINLASISFREDLELGRSPEGSFAFEGPVAAGETVRATLQLGNVDYVGLENVQEVRFYRKDGISLIHKATVQRTSAGQTTYEAEWDATLNDLGAEFGVAVVTLIPLLEFEPHVNSLRTLEDGSGEQEVTSRTQSASAAGDSDFDSYFGDFSNGLAGPAGATLQASDAGGSATTTQNVDVATTGGRLDSITMTGSGQTSGAEGESSQSVGVEFVTSAPRGITLAPTTTLSNVVEDDRTVRVILWEGATQLVCSEGADSDSNSCQAGVPTSLSGTLPAGSYILTVYAYTRGGTDYDYSATLTLGP